MEGRREAVATADELVESIRTLTDTVLEHAKSTDARIDALATEVRDVATEVRDVATEVRDRTTELRDLTTEVRDVATEVRDLTTEVRDLTTEVRDLTTEVRDGFRSLDRRIGRLETGTGPVASNR
jgi:uncharacterized protein YoxC